MFPNRCLQAASLAVAMGVAASPASAQSVVDPFLERLVDPRARELVLETLARSPRIGELAAGARAASHRAAQVGALPDLAIQFTGFLESPETRVGPQEWTLSASQPLPWAAKRRLRAEAASREAQAQAQDVESARLAVLTQLRVNLLELAFLEELIAINETTRQHLAQHETIARARYATGSGPNQGVIKLQAAITRAENQSLDFEARRLDLRARINGLRDRPPETPLPEGFGPEPVFGELNQDSLTDLAVRARPAMQAARLRIDRAGSMARGASVASRPDFKVGLVYTQVGTREDQPGVLQPPPGNGNDILGLQASLSFPLQRGRVTAGIEEAEETLRRRDEHRRVVKSELESNVAYLVQQLPIRWRQLSLIRDVLVVQAQEALDSATSGYIAGTLNSLDLLDAEHVLFEAETAVARARTDYLVAWTRLEGALGLPLDDVVSLEASP